MTRAMILNTQLENTSYICKNNLVLKEGHAYKSKEYIDYS